MNHCTEEQFSQEELDRIYEEKGPLAVLWNLKAIQSWTENGEDLATFGGLVKEHLPPIIDGLEKFLEKEDWQRNVREIVDTITAMPQERRDAISRVLTMPNDLLQELTALTLGKSGKDATA